MNIEDKLRKIIAKNTIYKNHFIKIESYDEDYVYYKIYTSEDSYNCGNYSLDEGRLQLNFKIN